MSGSKSWILHVGSLVLDLGWWKGENRCSGGRSSRCAPLTSHQLLSPRIQDPGSRIQHSRSNLGFTLLELMISMTILGLIFVAVLGAIWIGSKSWESGEQRAEASQRARALFETVARELTMLYPLRVKDQDKDVIAFHGTSDSLSFATLPQSYGAEPFSHMIRVVTYAVEPERGLVATESYPLVGAADASGPQEGRMKGLHERVSEARFRYLVPEGKPEEKLPPTWREFWDPSQDEAIPSSSQGLLSPGGQRPLQGSERLPLAVEITLTIRQTDQRGGRDLILPPLVFPVQVQRTL